MKRFLVLYSMIFTGVFTFGQQVNFIKYTVYDGLVSNPVNCIFQDNKGYVWIGTYDGLSRYDGYKFTNYTTANGLSHNLVNSIFEIDDRLLIAENNGAIDVIQNNIVIQKAYKARSAANFIGLHNNRVLIPTDSNGFYEYKEDSVFLSPQPKQLSAYGSFVSVNDSFFLGNDADDDLYLHRNDFGIQASFPMRGQHIFSIIQDSKKRIWACSTGGLLLLDIIMLPVPRISRLPVPPAFNFALLNNASVTSMVEEEDGSFWIGTLTGLIHLYPDGKFFIFNEKDGLPSARINTLYIDKEKNLWIGTALGLAKWVAKNNVVFFNTESQDFRNDIFIMSSLNDHKFILNTDHGLQEFDINTREFKNIKAPGHFSSVPVTGTSTLLVHYMDWIGALDHKKNRVRPLYRLDTATTGIVSAVKHPQGNIFLATFSGLYAINKTTVKRLNPHRTTCVVVDSNGYTWAGTWNTGLIRVKIINSSEGEYVMEEMTPRIKEREIRGLYVDRKKNIWVGTRYGGAFRFTATGNNDYNIQHFTRQSGLLSDWVISFAETGKEDMWIGSYLGIDKLVREDSGYRVFNFSKTVNFFAEIKKILPAGDHWVCLANTGIAIFKDEDLHQTPPLQPVIFSAALGVRDHEITLFSPTDKIILKPFQNAARFEFGALGFINERQLLYSYRLKGNNDTSWSKPSNIHQASYASLPPGEYSFEVKTIGWNGQEGMPATFSFYIKTPFWKQWWFIALVVVAALGLLYAFYRYRINQLVRLQKVRNNIATDLHDDIGSSLTNISILSELSNKNLSSPEKASSFLTRISEEVQASSQAMDDIIWSVNSRNDSLHETLARMRRYAAELFDNSTITCHLQLDENTANKKIGMELRRDIYLIYKEALNNIYKHASASNVWINVSHNQHHLMMQVKDDGKGFDTESITHRNGLKNLRSRAEKWKGKIQIHSATNEGTRIEIKLPIKE